MSGGDYCQGTSRGHQTFCLYLHCLLEANCGNLYSTTVVTVDQPDGHSPWWHHGLQDMSILCRFLGRCFTPNLCSLSLETMCSCPLVVLREIRCSVGTTAVGLVGIFSYPIGNQPFSVGLVDQLFQPPRPLEPG